LHGALRLRPQRRARDEPSDTWKNLKYNFGARPKPYLAGKTVNAFNGTSIGKGHLAEAKAAINSPRAAMNGAQSVFSRREEPHDTRATAPAAVAARVIPPSGTICWPRSRRRKTPESALK